MLVNKAIIQQVRCATNWNAVSSLASRSKYHHIGKSQPRPLQHVSLQSWPPIYPSRNSSNKTKSSVNQLKSKPLPPLSCKIKIDTSSSDSESAKPTAGKFSPCQNWKVYQSREQLSHYTNLKTNINDEPCDPCEPYEKEQPSPSDSKPCGCSCVGQDCQCDCGLPKYLLSPYYYVPLVLLSVGAGMALGSWYQNKYKKSSLDDAVSRYESDIKQDGQKAGDIERKLFELYEIRDSSQFDKLVEELRSLEMKAQLHEMTIEQLIRNLEKLKKRCQHLSYGTLDVKSDKECENGDNQTNGYLW